jgi:hypothetical protein
MTPPREHYKDIVIKSGAAFCAGALVGVLLGFKSAHGTQSTSVDTNRKMLIGGFGLGAALAVTAGGISALKAYEKSKLIQPINRPFKQS